MKVEAEQVEVSYGARKILKEVSINAGEREFVGIIGPNGSGKSTLLKCMYRILKPEKGCIYLDGREMQSMSVRESARKMAVVAQHNYYNFEFSVSEVVLMGRAPHKKSLERDNARDYEIVEEALKTVGMWEFRQRSFSTLSGAAESYPGKSTGAADPLSDFGRAYQPPGYYPSASAYETGETVRCHDYFCDS